ncbi:hypothetical protein J4E91_000176 [Alternaria rosae]|nr:hypothetical protein J4E91_000176 [Alternaria rosae]
MSIIPAYMVIRTTNQSEDLIPPVRVRSQRFQYLQERDFFANQNINRHCVTNPFFIGDSSMTMITAEVARDVETIVRIISKPTLQSMAAEQDLREQVAAGVQTFMLCGNLTLDFVADTKSVM